MATSPSEVAATRPAPAFEVVGGGVPTPEEVAAIAAALELLRERRPVEPEVSAWRWSGRWWWSDHPANWRGPARAAHPSRP